MSKWTKKDLEDAKKRETDEERESGNRIIGSKKVQDQINKTAKEIRDKKEGK